MNNQDVYLIDVAYIKSKSTIMSNVEDNLFKPSILSQQDIVIQKIMGSTLYDEMIEEYEDFQNHEASGGTSGITAFVEERFIDLVDKYISPTLLYNVLYKSVYDLYAKSTNKGINQQNSQNSFNAELHFVEKRRADYKNDAEFYEERLMKYLLNNQTLFPNFLSYTGDITTIQPKTSTNFFNGMYLKSSRSNLSEIARMKLGEE